MKPTATELLRATLATIPDFPKPGILFRDLAPVFADPHAFAAVTDELVRRFRGGFDAVAGVEARGFVLAAAAAYAARSPLVILRKAGKLPGAVLFEEYGLEYGTARLELEPGQLPAGSRVLVLDDVLATGGTLAAAASLIGRAGYQVAGFGVALELTALDGRSRLGPHRAEALLSL